MTQYFTDGNDVITSLCPVLGKKNAIEYRGFCPSYAQEPFGKTLDISFYGTPPYMYYNTFRGSDVLITKILAKKFGFTPRPQSIPAKTYASQGDQSNYTVVHQVRLAQ